MTSSSMHRQISGIVSFIYPPLCVLCTLRLNQHLFSSINSTNTCFDCKHFFFFVKYNTNARRISISVSVSSFLFFFVIFIFFQSFVCFTFFIIWKNQLFSCTAGVVCLFYLAIDVFIVCLLKQSHKCLVRETIPKK